MERDSFEILYTGYLLSKIKIKRDIERERERIETKRERETKKVDKNLLPKVNRLIS